MFHENFFTLQMEGEVRCVVQRARVLIMGIGVKSAELSYHLFQLCRRAAPRLSRCCSFASGGSGEETSKASQATGSGKR